MTVQLYLAFRESALDLVCLAGVRVSFSRNTSHQYEQADGTSLYSMPLKMVFVKTASIPGKYISIV